MPDPIKLAEWTMKRDDIMSRLNINSNAQTRAGETVRTLPAKKTNALRKFDDTIVQLTAKIAAAPTERAKVVKGFDDQLTNANAKGAQLVLAATELQQSLAYAEAQIAIYQ
jgi:hypothetical protein